MCASSLAPETDARGKARGPHGKVPCSRQALMQPADHRCSRSKATETERQYPFCLVLVMSQGPCLSSRDQGCCVLMWVFQAANNLNPQRDGLAYIAWAIQPPAGVRGG